MPEAVSSSSSRVVGDHPEAEQPAAGAPPPPPPPPSKASTNEVVGYQSRELAAQISDEIPNPVERFFARNGVDMFSAEDASRSIRAKLEHLDSAQVRRVLGHLQRSGELEKLCKSLTPEERARFLSLLADKGVFDRVPGQPMPGQYNVRPPDTYAVGNESKLPTCLLELMQDENFQAAAVFRQDYSVWKSNVESQPTSERVGPRVDPGRTDEEKARLRGGALPTAGQIISNPLGALEQSADAVVAAYDPKDRIRGMQAGDGLKYKAGLGGDFSLEVKREDERDFKVSLRYEEQLKNGAKIDVDLGFLEVGLGVEATHGAAMELEFRARSAEEATQITDAMAKVFSLDAAERNAAMAVLKERFAVVKTETSVRRSAEARVSVGDVMLGGQTGGKESVVVGKTKHGVMSGGISESQSAWALKVFGVKVQGTEQKREAKIERHVDAKTGAVTHEVKLKLTAKASDGMATESKLTFRVAPEKLPLLERALARQDEEALRSLAREGNGKQTTTKYETLKLGFAEQQRAISREANKL